MEHLFALLAQWWHALLPAFVVWPYEEGVHLSIVGAFTREVKPGFYFKWPFDMVHKCNVMPTSADMRAQSLVTADGVDVVVHAAIVWSVHNAARFLLEVEDQDAVLADSVYGVVTEMVTATKWADLSPEEFREECFKRARARAFRYGVRIDRLYFSDIARTQSLRLITDRWNSDGSGPVA